MSRPTRDTLVRDLTPEEASELLVHAHRISRERRQALLFKRGPASAYFTPEEIPAIKKWIEQEDYLPQDCKEYDHPKQATHWCSFCGHVVSCEHDKKKSVEPLSEYKALVSNLKACCKSLRWKLEIELDEEDILFLILDNCRYYVAPEPATGPKEVYYLGVMVQNFGTRWEPPTEDERVLSKRPHTRPEAHLPALLDAHWKQRRQWALESTFGLEEI